MGIDPGTVHMGYGVVDGEGDDVTFVDCGVLNASARESIGKRLLSLYQQLQNLMERVRPEAVSVEEAFVYRGPRKSALAVGEARAIALVAAAGCDLPVFQYAPKSVKQTIAGYGSGTKEQVREMLGIMLQQELSGYSLDACDALGVAVCHAQKLRFNNLVEAVQHSENGSVTTGMPRVIG